MAITHTADSLERIPAGAVNIRDVSDSWRNSLGNTPYSGQTQEEFDARKAAWKLFTYQTHVGLCLKTFERNGYHDSDFYVTVWNPETGKPEDIEYATTRGWTYANGASVDATPEVLAAYQAYESARMAAARKLHAERVAAMPEKGKVLRVVKGRKVPVGTEARCFWADVRFKTDRVLGVLFLGYEGRVGLETPAGRVFTDCNNVEVVA